MRLLFKIFRAVRQWFYCLDPKFQQLEHRRQQRESILASSVHWLSTR